MNPNVDLITMKFALFFKYRCTLCVDNAMYQKDGEQCFLSFNPESSSLPIQPRRLEWEGVADSPPFQPIHLTTKGHPMDLCTRCRSLAKYLDARDNII